jgi:hypothetical protein
VPNYDEEMKTAYALYVHAEEAVSVPSPDRRSISTWYKFTVLRDVSRAPLPARAIDQPPDKEIPQQLLPVLPNQILVPMVGGVVTIDGVQVRFGDVRQLFVPTKDYLIVVEPAASSEVMVLPAGGEMAFAVADDGDTLSPLGPLQNAHIQDEIQRRYHNSLRALSQDQVTKR